MERAGQGRRAASLGALLIVVYSALVLAPMGLAWQQGLSPRPFLDELSSGIALVAFAMLLVEFVLSGRHKGLSARLGMDAIMRFHQFMAHVLLAFLLIHPFLYTLPMGDMPHGDVTRVAWLNLSGWGGISGMLAWLLLIVLVFLAAVRDQLDWSYEAWRFSHALAALLVAGLGWQHTVRAGRYSEDPLLAGVWGVAMAVAVLTLVYVHVVTPLRQSRRPFRVAAVEQEADRTWTIRLEPDTDAGHPGDPFRYQAGQFAWLKVGGPLGRITEHPFSMSSAPSASSQPAFTIKQAGDFTNGIGDLPLGTRAYLDGPYGNFTLASDDPRPLIMLAGGVGMAPVMSLLRELRARDSQRRIVLFQANRHAGQVLYAGELDHMAGSLNLEIHQVLAEAPPQWAGHLGRIDRWLLEATTDEALRREAQWVVCGPPAMIDSLEATLMRDFGVPASAIVSEHFHYRFGDHTGTAGRFLRVAAVVTLGLVIGVVLFAARSG